MSSTILISFTLKHCFLPKVFGALILSKPQQIPKFHDCLLNLFSHLVDAEKTMVIQEGLLSDKRKKNCEELDAKDENSTRVRKKVSFQKFDFSSCSPPIDRQLGSELHVKEMIVKIENVLQCVHCLCDGSIEFNREKMVETLTYVVDFFQMLSGDDFSLSKSNANFLEVIFCR